MWIDVILIFNSILIKSMSIHAQTVILAQVHGLVGLVITTCDSIWF